MLDKVVQKPAHRFDGLISLTSFEGIERTAEDVSDRWHA
jgi:hypothetical protein